MHFETLSAICFNLDQSKILLSCKGLILNKLYFELSNHAPDLSLQGHQKVASCQKKLSENIVGKGEIAGYKHFLLFPQSFLSY